jgi:CheY-like chemotaxis protein
MRRTETGSNPADKSFVRELGRALRHLYSPIQLRESPLTQLLNTGSREDPAAALRRVLLQAIDALKPQADVPSATKAWRLYRVLLHRHIEQFSQSEAASNLALSTRQLRRDEGQALQLLADHLWAHYELEAKWQDGERLLRRRDEELPGLDMQTPSLEQELESLGGSLWRESADVQPVIQAALRVVGPLAREFGVRVGYSVPENLPWLLVQITTMRQALLNVLTVAIRSAPGGSVEIKAETQQSGVGITIVSATREPDLTPLSESEAEPLRMAQELIRLSGGTLEVETGGDGEPPFTANLVIPATSQISVLVIDDNADALQLFHRCLSGSRYRFVGTPDPESALALAEESGARAIVLDVMLPEVDGWELLGRIHEHPKTRHIPVIVCTVLPQGHLALSLGAAAFIRKPVSRTALLSALDRQLGQLLTESM